MPKTSEARNLSALERKRREQARETGQAFSVSPVRRATVWLVAIKLAGLVAVVDPSSVDPFAMTKSVFSRGTEWFLAALVLLLVLRFGWSVVPRTRLHLGALALLVASALSTVSAENRYLALHGDIERYLGFTFVVDMFVLYAAIVIACRAPEDWRVLAGGLIGGATVAFVYEVVQLAGLDPVPWAGDPRVRPFSTFGNTDLYGLYLGSAFGAVAGAAVVTRSSRVRVACVIGVALVALAAFPVGSRGTIIGVGVAVVAAAFVVAAMRWPLRRVVGRGVLVVLAVGVVTAGTLALQPVRARAADVALTVFRERALIYESAVRAIADRPMFGWGTDDFGVAYPRYRQVETQTVFGKERETSAHSWPLEVAATEGLIGLATLCVALIAFAWAAISNRAALVLSGPAVVASAAFWSNALVAIESVSTAWIPWAAFAWIAAAVAGRPIPASRPRALHPLLTSLVAITALIGAGSGISVLGAARSAEIARVAWTNHITDPAVAAARSAVRADPGRARYWNYLGLSLNQSGLPREAGDAFEQAASRGPDEETFWANLARARAKQVAGGDRTPGVPDAALLAAQRAVAVDPNNLEPNVVLAEVAIAIERYDQALPAAVHAIEITQADPTLDGMAAAAAVLSTDKAAAKSQLERALRVKDSATLRIALARVEQSLGDHAAAVAALRRAKELEPNNPAVDGVLRDIGE